MDVKPVRNSIMSKGICVNMTGCMYLFAFLSDVCVFIYACLCVGQTGWDHAIGCGVGNFHKWLCCVVIC